MKKILSIICLVAVSFSLIHCGGSDGGDPSSMTDQQKIAQALKDGSPWTIVSVDSKPDGSDAEALDGLKLSFGISGSGAEIAPTTFTSTGVEALVNDPGASWSFDGSSTTSVSLTGAFTSKLTGIQLLPNVDDPTSVSVTFELSSIGGRTNGIGEYTITLE